jgi:hypothetical protein
MLVTFRLEDSEIELEKWELLAKRIAVDDDSMPAVSAVAASCACS